MPAAWFRLDNNYPRHRKTLRLRRLISDEADCYPVRLMAWCSDQSRSSGRVSGRVDLDLVEDICEWRGKKGRLVQAMVEVGMIDADASELHGFMERSGVAIMKFEEKRENDRAGSEAKRVAKKVARQEAANGGDPAGAEELSQAEELVHEFRAARRANYRDDGSLHKAIPDRDTDAALAWLKDPTWPAARRTTLIQAVTRDRRGTGRWRGWAAAVRSLASLYRHRASLWQKLVEAPAPDAAEPTAGDEPGEYAGALCDVVADAVKRATGLRPDWRRAHARAWTAPAAEVIAALTDEAPADFVRRVKRAIEKSRENDYWRTRLVNVAFLAKNLVALLSEYGQPTRSEELRTARERHQREEREREERERAELEKTDADDRAAGRRRVQASTAAALPPSVRRHVTPLLPPGKGEG